jgi:hypothetical protein
MVLGVNRKRTTFVSHMVTVVFEKEKFQVTCSCGFKDSLPTRQGAFSRAHLHLASLHSEPTSD